MGSHDSWGGYTAKVWQCPSKVHHTTSGKPCFPPIAELSTPEGRCLSLLFTDNKQEFILPPYLKFDMTVPSLEKLSTLHVSFVLPNASLSSAAELEGSWFFFCAEYLQSGPLCWFLWWWVWFMAPGRVGLFLIRPVPGIELQRSRGGRGSRQESKKSNASCK